MNDVDEAVKLLDPAARRVAAAPRAAGSAFDAVPAEESPAHASTGQAEGAPRPERAADRHEWRIRCHDALDRERCLTVVVHDSKVLVVGPPGETAVLSPGQLGQFRTALLEAAKQAEG